MDPNKPDLLFEVAAREAIRNRSERELASPFDSESSVQVGCLTFAMARNVARESDTSSRERHHLTECRSCASRVEHFRQLAGAASWPDSVREAVSALLSRASAPFGRFNEWSRTALENAQLFGATPKLGYASGEELPRHRAEPFVFGEMIVTLEPHPTLDQMFVTVVTSALELVGASVEVVLFGAKGDRLSVHVRLERPDGAAVATGTGLVGSPLEETLTRLGLQIIPVAVLASNERTPR